MRKFNFDNKVVLEVGPGFLPHLKFWNGKPKEYIASDIKEEYLEYAKLKIGSSCKTYLLANRYQQPPIENNKVDIILSFYSLEHLQDLDSFLNFSRKILKKDGLLIGAIPNEGGLLWGLGRLLSSKINMEKKGFNYSKVISWEHPNYVDNIISKIENSSFVRIKLKKLPFNYLSSYDLNLVTSFAYKNKK